MRYYLRCVISGILIALLLTCTVPGAASASTQPAIPLEKAIQIVRQNFDIPAAFTNFSSSFSQSTGIQAWYLVWSDPAQKDGNFSAQVDATTGEVISMNLWQPEAPPQSRIPGISWTEAQHTAAELLQRLIPARLPSLVLIEDLEPIPLTATDTPAYTINWRRVSNGIPVEGIGAWVVVSAADGHVQAYSLNWSPLPLPDPTGIISPAAAGTSFNQHGLIQLQYREPIQFFPMSTATPPSSPLLVYRLDHPSNGMIDAFTGQPLIPEAGLWITGGGADGKGGAEGSPSEAVKPLTPEEQAEIIKLAGLIPSEQAAATIIKWANPGDNLVLRTASLEQDWRDPDLRIWSLTWSSGPGKDTAPTTYLYGRVNARSGELLSFSLGLPADTGGGNPLSRSSARNLADDFLRRLQGDRFSQFVLDPNSLDNLDQGKVPTVMEAPYWSFRFIRNVEGINFPDNGADITIDRAHRQITSYNLTWNYADLPKAEGLIGLDRANQIYLQAAPLTLQYSPLYSAAKGDVEMRLVYQPLVPAAQPDFRMIEAHSGMLVDEEGKPVMPKTQARLFQDITGNFAEKEIALLGKAGLMTEYGDQFHPDEEVSLASLLRAMQGAADGLDSIREITDEQVVQKALEKGWLKEQSPPEAKVSRGQLSQLMVRFLTLDYLAKLQDIYVLPYLDSSAIDADLRGYVALCWGLKIIRADGITFQSRHQVSRAEAAAALVRALGIVK